MGQRLKGLLVLCALSVLAVAAWRAGAQPWLSEDERLLRGDVIISFKEAPDTYVHEVQGEILYDCTPEVIWSILIDYAAYARIFPDLESSEPLKREGNLVRVKFRINNLWPTPDFEYVLRFTEDRAARSLSWIMEEGTFKKLSGAATLEPFAADPAKTKMTYRLTRDPGWFVPSINSDLANRSVVIERLMALRKEVRDRKKSLENNQPESEIKPKWRKALFWWEKDENEQAPPGDDQPPKKPPEKK